MPVAALLDNVALLKDIFASLEFLKSLSQIESDRDQVDRIIVDHEDFLVAVKQNLCWNRHTFMLIDWLMSFSTL